MASLGSITVIGEIRKLNLATGPDLEVRARCQDDGHPVGAIHPWWFGGQAGSVCHCGRVIYRGELPVVQWPRPAAVHRVPQHLQLAGWQR